MYIAKRSVHNPILNPNPERAWEMAAFNGCPIKKGKTTHLLYRAMRRADPLLNPPTSISIIGHATSKDGNSFEDHEQFVTPSEPWDTYGCEDPRVTLFEGRYYIFYTGLGGIPFSASNIKIACAVSNDLKKVTEKHLVTPFNAKAMTLFPKRVRGKATVILTAHQDEPPQKIAIAQADNVEDFWNPDYWTQWHEHIDAQSLTLIRSHDDFAEVGAPPIETKDGWLLIYSYMKDYFKGDARVFGIEAILLDLDDPHKIIGRTQGPFLVPEESYEGFGVVRSVVFPSGALVEGDRLDIYYGGADTVCAKASIHLPDLLDSMRPHAVPLFTRADENPIILPDPSHPWESRLAFNPTAIDIDGTAHIIYRAMGADNTSVMGYASSADGIHIDERLPEPIYVPRAEFEKKHGSPTGNSGCEDARLTRIKNTVYMSYTAYDGASHTRVAVSHISVDDFAARKFDRWSEPHLITPPSIDEKDVCIFPEQIGGQYMLLHRVSPMICATFFKTLDFEKEEINRCIELMGPRPGTWESDKVGIAGSPIKTQKGWLLIYHAVSSDKHYSLGAALLDLKDPTRILGRTVDPILSPDEPYEKIGEIPNVVFCCGAIVRDDTLFVYYGGADTVTGVATCSLSKLLNVLSPKSLSA